MLRKDLFGDNKQELLKASKEFWHTFSQAIAHISIDVNGELNEIADQRIIRFYDTDDYLLYRNSYILRERQDVNNDEKEVTLKFRHPDRYISQDRDMKVVDIDRGETKFEEDIKTPFGVLYSFSSTQKLLTNEKLDEIQDAAQLYPDLVDKISTLKGEDKIRTIGIDIREIVVKGARFQIRNNPQIYSKCALIVWYENNQKQEKPLAVEFSFKYGDENEEYTRKMAQRAYDVFQILQEKLIDWVDLNSDTKTAYIYKLDRLNNCKFSHLGED
ncbi:hypothetical protein A6770_14060 [Nostoc minutum NIES-26]|uniref:CYTH domain-containing protein n=1 Tax=Nostoc minutum NIES-26 TaxID=1844469 RepID=A0A367RQB9_9NOSO|nr:hypothetical protein A6770_14060 [Nostoc minutum NIES-26]